MYKRIIVIASAIVVLFSCTLKKEDTKKAKSRSDIPSEYKWDISTLCNDSSAWTNDYAKIETEIEKFAQSELKLDSPQNLFATLYYQDSLYNELLRLYLYAMMQEHVDLNDESAQAMRMQMDILESNFYEGFAVVERSVLKLDSLKLKKWIAVYPKLNQYDFYIKDLIHRQKHIPTKEQAQILSNYSLPSETIKGVYNELFYSDLTEPDYDYLNPNRSERIKSYEEYTHFFKSKRNTVAALIVTDIQLKYAYAKSIGYASVLHEDLYNDNVPVQLYHNLLLAMKTGSKAIQKYHRLRAEILDVEDYQASDKDFRLHTSSEEYNYDTAKTMIKHALIPLGPTYQSYLDSMFTNNKIDVFDNEGKVSTMAYTVSAFGNSPFLLTTYQNEQSDIFDLIHELGHSVHVMFSMESQPISTYESSIIKDEITSTLNELFLTDYLLENAHNSEEKLHVLETAINNIEYYFSQAKVTDFTYRVFSEIESGNSVTASTLDSLFMQTLKDYNNRKYVDNSSASNWTMYGMLDYYSYKYVLSMTVSLLFYESIKNEGDKAIQQYLDFLKMGGDDYPLDQLKKAGIHLNNEKSLSAIVDYTKTLVDRYEEELAKAEQ
ncbi:gluzincin family metallopeptidase [Sunxiuqinia indica]|uniref:M3 family metallopeptidase n=1 Tax=Sunxiuqinia indica TaxID=2692584 RepID=UPI001358B6CF|nr:M3 family metallopeptidase [Sunxiuqinia indica]